MTAATGGEAAVAGGDYRRLLETSHHRAGSMLCLGLDPVLEYVPAEFGGEPAELTAAFCTEVLSIVSASGRIPAAFKPNIGFFHVLDRPRAGDFGGSTALARVLDLIRDEFPGIPVILDAKRGDIARSARNYGDEAFSCWGVDAVTASPYLGDDAVLALLDSAREANGLAYVLALTSNPGAGIFQNLALEDGAALVDRVAAAIAEWQRSTGACGAVVGATHPRERDRLFSDFAAADVPLLVPGVGSQGGSAAAVAASVRSTGYPGALMRVNVSSAILHPWKDAGAPVGWRDDVHAALESFHEELQ